MSNTLTATLNIRRQLDIIEAYLISMVDSETINIDHAESIQKSTAIIFDNVHSIECEQE